MHDDWENGERQYRDGDGTVVLAAYQEPAWRADFVARDGSLHAGIGSGGAELKDVDTLVAAGRAFRLDYLGEGLFPRAQFDENLDPLPVIAELVALAISAEIDWWLLAYWLDTPNDLLGDSPPGVVGARRPVDLLHSAPHRVVKVIQRELGMTDDF
jgi:hypothetical protein